VSTLEQQLSMAVSTVVSMGTSLNAIGNICALATLPSYPAANMVYTLVLPTAGGTGVIQGGEVVVSAVRGSYVVGGATTVMCGSSGWVGTPPATVSQCTPNCGICTGTTDCSSCNPGYFSNVTARFASQTLNPSLMTFDPVGAKTRGTLFNAATMDASTGIWLRGKTSLLTGTPNSGTWSNNIYYDVIGCYAPVWLQVDLGSEMRVGTVSTWKYWFDRRQYCGQRIAISSTGLFQGEETDISEHSPGLRGGGYGLAETAAGLTVSAYGVSGRYIRVWSANSNANSGVHFVGIRATAAPLSAATTTICSPV
jgi:hypothetical protein